MQYAIETRLVESSGAGYPIRIFPVGDDFELAFLTLSKCIEDDDYRQLDPMTEQSYHLMQRESIWDHPGPWLDCVLP